MSQIECAFCGIAEGTVPTERIFEDQQNIAVLAKLPTPLGHTIVFPKRHVLNFSELTPEEQISFSQLWGLVELALITLLKQPRAINLKSGGFEPHLHMHVYPVDMDTSWQTIKDMFENKTGTDYPPAERKSLLLQLTDYLNHDTNRNTT